MFVVHFVATVIPNPESFGVFVSDKPFLRYHWRRQLAAKLLRCVQIRVSYVKVEKNEQKKIFFCILRLYLSYLTIFISIISI